MQPDLFFLQSQIKINFSDEEKSHIALTSSRVRKVKKIKKTLQKSSGIPAVFLEVGCTETGVEDNYGVCVYEMRR